VPRESADRQHTTSLTSGAGFKVRTRINLHVVEDKGDAEFSATFTHESGVVATGRSRVVVDVVHRDHKIGSLGEQQEPE
jgi:hypothetical protein